ncbi:ricin-type beta-trefoil lectin protein [Novosphingobium sp. PhB55]|uniref:RICIN domain-containing protein n=1 Tax=Novosphingobium sp. PhB55 TaxID=2485106 RepID=UPI0010F11025|nr:RICIN domain-containing protein [Novosphingobium sp. PhB55]TDW61597.1 ricin-type beta-trefoil lectin protein [Novosphingobium sp. PhB55]
MDDAEQPRRLSPRRRFIPRFAAAASLLVAAGLFIGARPQTYEGEETFAIQNVETGKNIRPKGGRSFEGNSVVVYNLHKWGCLTWRYVPAADGSVLLANVYSKKMLGVSGQTTPGATLAQYARSSSSVSWDIEEHADGSFLIRLHGTQLYVTATSGEINSAVVLAPPNGSNLQNWRLIKQKPWI